MKIQTEATNVLQRASANLRSGLLKEKPAWFDIVAKHPPTHNLIKVAHQKPKKVYRNPKAIKIDSTGETYKTRESKSDLKSRNNEIHRIPKLRFEEDALRKVFYQQHPWELARPKNLIENSGEDNKKCDWSRMLQLHKPLDGESVVQRTLWLHQNKPGWNRFKAYDTARFEFYKLRMMEEMESHVAREESTMYGAVFASSNIDWNVAKEQEYIDVWTKLAEEKTRVLEANMSRSSAPVGSIMEEEKAKTSIFEELLMENGLSNEPENVEEK